MLPDATPVQESLTSLFNPFWELPDQTFLRLCTDDLQLLSEQVMTSTKDLPPQYANEAAITSAAVVSHALAVCAFIQQQPHLSHEEVTDHINEAMPTIPSPRLSSPRPHRQRQPSHQCGAHRSPNDRFPCHHASPP